MTGARGALLAAVVTMAASGNALAQNSFKLSSHGYLEARGANVLVFSNAPGSTFNDEKISGVELIHHDVRTATNGDVRLSNTPEQWDPTARLVGRKVDTAAARIAATLSYPQYRFQYRIQAEPRGDGVLISVQLDQPLPRELVGIAGFNMEFLPSAYFGRTYVADDRTGIFPRHPTGPMYTEATGRIEAAPLASGGTLVLAPEDPERRVTIGALDGGKISLYDGRNKAQNGWFVVRTLLPAGRTGRVVQWLLTPSRMPGYTRPPVIAHSQVGYHPNQEKVAVIELDPNYRAPLTASLYRIQPDGRQRLVLEQPARRWGRYLRYDYARFDFSSVREPGLYIIAFGGVRSEPFRIANDVYAHIWQSSLDTYLAVQMDHMYVKDGYRVWHGAAHMDDARQAPAGHVHFDLYRQGPSTDDKYKDGEHIPGLNVGGWFDAGDFDIRTPSQQEVVTQLSEARETFGVDWDDMAVHRKENRTYLHTPDGVPDILQQIEQGVLQLLAQYEAVGHAINGIIEPTLALYTHLGDAASKTDGLIYSASLDSLQSDGIHSGRPDDRWAFTNKSTSLDYGSAASLAAASRVLRGYNDALADSCLHTALRVWDEEIARPQAVVFQYGNATGGPLQAAELNAAVELLLATKDRKYADRISALWPTNDRALAFFVAQGVRVKPYMDTAFARRLEAAVRSYKTSMDAEVAGNPFGVPITTGGWAGSGTVLNFAVRNYILHKAYPQIIGPEYTLRAIDFILGTHPASSTSLVSGIGVKSRTIAYGNNRADYSFIPGGVVPGVLIVKPDFPEMKEDWPFLWYEGEYVIPEAAMLVYAGNAVNDLLH